MERVNRDAALAMIGALRAQLDALEYVVGAPEDMKPLQGCEHPEEKREPTGAFSAPHQYLCRACMEIVNPDAPEGQE